MNSRKGGAILAPGFDLVEQAAQFAKIVRFGVYELDLHAGELTKRGCRIRLQDQPLCILSLLLERRGELVSREELRKHLWQDETFVDFDHSLNAAVMRLREALNDSSENPRFIATIPRKGYRFIAPVEEGAAPSISTAEPELSLEPPSKAVRSSRTSAVSSVLTAPKRTKQRWHIPNSVLYFALGVVSAALAFVLFQRQFRTLDVGLLNSPKIKSVVVLPLENLAGDQSQDFFADGMTDDLIANLAKIRSLRVISRSTAMAYKGVHKSLPQIASELSVDAVVEGTVLRVGDRVRITAELVQVSTDGHLWAETYEGSIADVLGLQNKVSAAIVDEIRIQLTPEEKERLARQPAVSPDVYENYLKGRYYWNRRSSESIPKAIGYFEYATRKDPQYALAYAGLADCYGIIGATIFGTMPADEAAPKAKAAATHALELDPTLAEAHTSLSTIKFNYDWDWKGAEAGFRRAIDLNPSYATAYQRYSLYLSAMGRSQEGLEQIEKARQLDPLSMSIHFSIGWRFYMARRYDRAIEQLKTTLDMDPSYELPYLVLGQAYEQTGDMTHAISYLRKGADLAHYSPLMTAALAHAYAHAGNEAAAEKLLEQLMTVSRKEYVSPYYLAVIDVGLGKNEEAVAWLEKAYADHSNGMVFLKVEPQLDPLRASPRFQELQRKMNFPD